MPCVALGAGQADVCQTRASSLRTRVKDVVTRAAQERVMLTFSLEGHLDVATLNALHNKPFKSV
jgi:hypothetical protein